MKRRLPVIIALSILFLSVQVNAQSKAGADYFKGTWSVLLKGTPGGDGKLTIILNAANDSITGVAKDTTGAELSKITNVDLKDTSISFGFTAQGYDVTLVLNKRDDDHVYGSLMDMFDAEGERVRDQADIKK